MSEIIESTYRVGDENTHHEPFHKRPNTGSPPEKREEHRPELHDKLCLSDEALRFLRLNRRIRRICESIFGPSPDAVTSSQAQSVALAVHTLD